PWAAWGGWGLAFALSTGIAAGFLARPETPVERPVPPSPASEEDPSVDLSSQIRYVPGAVEDPVGEGARPFEIPPGTETPLPPPEFPVVERPAVPPTEPAAPPGNTPAPLVDTPPLPFEPGAPAYAVTQAPADAVSWLLARQRRDGSWGEGTAPSTIRTTAWALWAIEEAAAKRLPSATSEAAVLARRAAQAYLADRQRPDGAWEDPAQDAFTTHAVALIAFVGTEGPPQGGSPAAARAVRFASERRTRTGGGGWGFTRDDPLPNSWTTSWMLLALSRARESRLPVDAAVMRDAALCLQRATDERSGWVGLRHRQEAPPPSRCVAAAALAAQIKAGAPAQATRLRPVWRALTEETARWRESPSTVTIDLEYWLLLSIASGCQNAPVEGASLRAASERAASILDALQVRASPDAGSLPALPSPWRPGAGAVESTALGVLIRAFSR
ncbi:MAG: hypothetical protein HY608_07215, partial [Planctomycetes bacterium]|nr:hypothetical protein [Planctomycetota bacterium]